jgi:hypothetical protein
MTDEIERALSDDEWEAGMCQFDDMNGQMTEVVHSVELADHEAERVFFIGREWPTEGVLLTDHSQVTAVIAIANHALPDSDPRKITRERVTAVRDFLNGVDEDSRFDDVREVAAAFANALESYLPKR